MQSGTKRLKTSASEILDLSLFDRLDVFSLLWLDDDTSTDSTIFDLPLFDRLDVFSLLWLDDDASTDSASGTDSRACLRFLVVFFSFIFDTDVICFYSWQLAIEDFALDWISSYWILEANAAAKNFEILI